MRISINMGCILLMLLPWMSLTAEAHISFDRTLNQDNMGQIRFSDIQDIAADNKNLVVLSKKQVDVFHWKDMSRGVSASPLGKQDAFDGGGLRGVALLPKQRLALVHQDEHRWAILSATGQALVAIGHHGEQEGELSEPVDVAYSAQNRLYILEQDNQRVSVFSPDGVFLFSFGQGDSKKENLKNPKNIAVDQWDRVYVLDDGDGSRISVYSSKGLLKKQISSKDLEAWFPKKPKLQALDVTLDGVLILADKVSGNLVFLDWQKNKVLDRFGSEGDGRGQFKSVRSLSFDETSRKLFVLDAGNKKIEVLQTDYAYQKAALHADLMGIQKSSVLRTACPVSYLYDASTLLCLNPDANEVKLLTPEGSLKRMLSATFDHPKRAAFDDKQLYILDKQNIKVFNHQGDFLFSMGKRGSKKGQLSDAQAIALGARVYVADTGNHRIQVFTRNGVFFKAFGHDKNVGVLLDEPTAVAVDHREQVYVADQKTGLVTVFNQQGEVLDILGESNPKKKDYLVSMDDVMVDVHNTLYVMGSTHDNDKLIQVYQHGHRLLRFSPLHIEPKVGVDANWKGTQVIPKTGVQAVDSVLGVAGGAVQALTGVAANAFGLIKKGFFASDDAPWLFNHAQNNDALLALVDPNAQARHTFLFLRVPKAVSELHMNGDTQHVYLSWKPVSNHFSGSYRIYATQASGAEKMLTEVLETDIELPRSGVTQYRLVSVSAYGKHSKPSMWFGDAFQQGLDLYQHGDFSAAKQYFQQALSDNPQHQGALEYLGRTQIAMRKYQQAAETFAKLARFPKARVRAYILQVEALVQAKAWLQAKTVLDQAMQNNMANAKLYGLCGQTLNALDDTLGAIGCVQKAEKLQPKEAQWDMRLSALYDEIGADDQALTALQQAEQKAASDASVWLKIGQIYEHKKLLNKAAYCYMSAIEKDTQNQQAYISLSGVYIAQGDLDKARQSAIAMASLPALRGMANYVLGRVALNEGKHDKALSLLLKSVKSDSQRPEVWLALADVYHQIPDAYQEQKSLQKTLALEPYQADVYQRLGALCLAEQNMTCAQTAYDDALGLYPMQSRFKLGLAQTYLGQNKPLQAETLLRKLLQSKSHDVAALRLLARTLNMQGRVAESISTLQQAIRLDDSQVGVHLQLAHAYMSNHMYDQAEAEAEKTVSLAPTAAAPHAMLGDIYLARQMFDKAIHAFTDASHAEADNPSYQQKLNLAYLQKKKFAESGGGASGPKLVDLKFEPVFAAAYKQYADHPMGVVSLKNDSGIDFKNIKVSFQIKEYMDFPTTYVVDTLPAGQTVSVNLKASFNNRVLDIDENTGLQTEVSAEYFMAGTPHTETLNQPITVYGRNAIVWNQTDMLGAFVTPKDQVLNVFIRQMINQYKPEKSLLNDPLSKAMTVYDVFHAMNMRYVVDPNNPYSKLEKTQVDTVQYPRETLRVKSGDCDDLSVLMSASLENLGIETAILDVPEHLLMMFNTGLPESEGALISTDRKLLAIVNHQVWIPVEATLVGASFSEAWVEGAKKFHRYAKAGSLHAVHLHHVWQQVTPVTLPPADFKVALPDDKKVRALLNREYQMLLQKAVARLIAPYQSMLAFDAHNLEAKMQIGIIEAKNGLYQDAVQVFKSILTDDSRNTAALNNLGNVHYLLKHYDKAVAYYEEVATLMPNNADVLVNMAMSAYQNGQIQRAMKVFNHAVDIDGSVKKRYSALASLLAK